ncbi:MAG: MarR family transcriptional regulator [Gemmatimonadetes bacterium]|nr:MarR family transcriptional regulator [Gemmatimonadota bacterium]
MGLSEELGFPRRLVNEDHEALLSIVVTGEVLRKEANRLFAPLGITGAQANVLILLHAQTEDGAMSQSDLGRLLTVHRSNVTGLLDRLEAQGLVRRQDDVKDRRVYRVALTEAGRESARRAEELYLGRIHRIMSVLEPPRWRALSSSLEKIRTRARTD